MTTEVDNSADSANPFDSLAAANYSATPEAIADIARLGAAGDAIVGRVSGVYLRALVARAQSNARNVLAVHPAPPADDLMRGIVASAAATAHREFYAAVLEGINTEDVADDSALQSAERKRRALERNRRSNFARTASSALNAYLREVPEADLLALDVSALTKSALTDAVAMARAKLRAGSPEPGDGPATMDTDASTGEQLAALIAECNRSARRMTRALWRMKLVDGAKATTGAAHVRQWLDTHFPAA